MEDDKHIDAIKMLRKPQGNFVRSNNEYSEQEISFIQKDRDYLKFKK